LDAATVEQLSQHELAQFLFRPGFTTAAVGAISGRGVGLDVVRDTVQRLQGAVELESSFRAGTAFIITVPISISTLRIVTVLAGGQYYGIPTHALLRIGRAQPDDLYEYQGAAVLSIDGQPVRWVPLADLLGLAANHSVASEVWTYVLVTGSEGRIAVAVDELEQESEVLLKPLAYPLTGLPGMIGATIRADGAVQLVVDLSSPAFGRTSIVSKQPSTARPAASRILVVDDSPTTRAVLRKVLTAAGYSVRTATDGLDALERLRTQAVDLVVCDVEMPRLNGLDFTRQAKSRYQIPIILVTGKEKEEHRREGLQAGADAYLVKSTFAGEGLLDLIKQLI
jgi:two-component system, chemotaxis family, sensor kinase CheA